MNNKQPETKSKSIPGIAHLLTWILCWGTLILVCASAPAQNLFVSGGNSVYEITLSGVETTFASGLTSSGALTFDQAGNLFVLGSSSIYKFTPDGVRSTFASGSYGPWALAFDSVGNLYVTNGSNIDKVTPSGVRSTFASGLDGPWALAVDSANNLFVTDSLDVVGPGHAHIYKISPAGARTTIASGLLAPTALAFDSAGNLFVLESGDIDGLGAAIYEFTANGERHTFASPFQCIGPGLVIDSADNLFVPDWCNGDIHKFTPLGVESTFVSGSNHATGSFLAFQPTQTPTATLVNISTRASVETGDNVLISGFIVSGSDSKPVIIRGLGPTLTNFGVPDALQDPVLELHNTTSMMTINDDWQSAANAAQIPASPIDYRPSDSRESAIMITLPPGAYTAVMHGKNSTTGNGLVEVYSTLSGLANVSTRGFVGTGDNVLIGGFISSGGNDSIQVIIRALGPTLTQFGVNGALADPTLSIRDGNGNVVASNDNWKATQQTAIQNSGFAPPNDLESALITTLTNGNYTAIVSGKNGATGVGLLEVYKVALAVNQ